MHLGSTFVEETFAEAFRMRVSRVVITAASPRWALVAATEMTGYAASIIGCDAEAGIERLLEAAETPDGRPGVSVLVFGTSTEKLAAAVVQRVGQCVMTCPTTAVFDGLPHESERIGLGKQLRYFGDGWQQSKLLDDRRYWRVPVMDGEFLVEDQLGSGKGVAGGCLILQGISATDALVAAERGIQAVANMRGVIAPFPGGLVRSGSKVGSRYAKLRASTNEAYCPTLRGLVTTRLQPAAEAAYEIVLDGLDEATVGQAMAAVMRAAAGPELIAIGAANFEGKLGKFHFPLRHLLSAD